MWELQDNKSLELNDDEETIMSKLPREGKLSLWSKTVAAHCKKTPSKSEELETQAQNQDIEDASLLQEWQRCKMKDDACFWIGSINDSEKGGITAK